MKRFIEMVVDYTNNPEDESKRSQIIKVGQKIIDGAGFYAVDCEGDKLKGDYDCVGDAFEATTNEINSTQALDHFIRTLI